MPKVSVIIPVYKAEKYLRQCVDSILSQTFTDWECILVDDGSPDGSGAICDEYAAKDARIQVIHKENGGVSSARNEALDKINGEWLTFVDSDDCLYPNALQKWVDVAEKNNLDLIQCHYNRDYCGEQLKCMETEVLTAQQYIQSDNYIMCIGGSFFRASIVKDHNLHFNKNIRLGEDQIFLLSYMKYCLSIQRIGDVLYFYRDNEQSAVNNPRPEYEIASVRAFKELKYSNNLAQKQCDLMLYTWFISLVLKSNKQYKVVSNLFKDIELEYCNSNCTILAKIGFYLYQLNHGLSIRVLRFFKPIYLLFKSK